MKAKTPQEIKEEKQIEALFKLVESYSEQKPAMMIPYVHFLILKEALSYLMRENEEMKSKLQELEKPAQPKEGS